MPLIKNTHASDAIRDAVVLDLGDLMHQAEHILENAAIHAAATLDEARAEAARLRETAMAEGRQAGHAAGLVEGREQGAAAAREAIHAQLAPQLGQLADQWTTALEKWQHERHEMHSAAREDVLEFAFELARRVVHRIVEIDPTVVEDQLAEALTLVRNPTGLSVAVHPEDRTLVESSLPGLVSAIDGAAEIAIQEDPAIARGGCVVRMTGGRIDARIDTQLDRIARTLLARSPRLHSTSEERRERP